MMFDNKNISSTYNVMPEKIRVIRSRSKRNPSIATFYATSYGEMKKTPVDYDANVGKIILHVFKDNPNFIGQIDADTQQKVTFQEMRERSVKCALWLKKNGISAKSVVAICARNQMDVYVPFLACLYINAIAYIWNNVSFDRGEPLAILSRTNPDVVFIQDCYVPQLLRAIRMLPKYRVKLLYEKKIVTFGETEEFTSLENILRETVCTKEIDEFSCTECNLRDTAMMMYTTSTLGYLEEIHFPYVLFISPSNQFPPVMASGDIGLWCEPFWWTYSPLLTVRSILTKVTAIKTLTDMYNLEGIFQLIQKYKVNWVFLKYNLSVEIKSIEHIVQKYDISSLKQFVYDSLDIQCYDVIYEHTRYLGEDVVCVRVYGTPETGVILTHIGARKWQPPPPELFSFINNNTMVLIVDFKTKKNVRPEVLGEIWFYSPCVVSRSARHNMRDIRSGCIIPMSDEWFCTGDYGLMTMDGTVISLGKISHSVQFMIHRKMYYFSQSTFQALLLQRHPNKVSHVVVTTIPNRLHNQIPLLFVWKKPGEKVTKKELQETLKVINPDIATCTIIRFVLNDLPLYPNGEINRQKVVASLKYDCEFRKNVRVPPCNLCKC